MSDKIKNISVSIAKYSKAVGNTPNSLGSSSTITPSVVSTIDTNKIISNSLFFVIICNFNCKLKTLFLTNYCKLEVLIMNSFML